MSKKQEQMDIFNRETVVRKRKKSRLEPGRRTISLLLVFVMCFSMVSSLGSVETLAAENNRGIFGFSVEADENSEASTDNSKTESGDSKSESGDSESEFDGSTSETDTDENAGSESVSEEETPAFTSGTLTAHGSDYAVTLTYDASAKIPADTKLVVSEITDRAYDSYIEDADEQLKAEKKITRAARLFDIKIMYGEDEIQPETGVSVTITLTGDDETSQQAQANEALDVLHFEEEGGDTTVTTVTSVTPVAAVTPAEASTEDTSAGAVEFTADSFSVYGIIYTVDFSYGEYSFSMPGDGEIPLSEIFKQLKIRDRMNNVLAATFSDDSLVKVIPVDGAGAEIAVSDDGSDGSAADDAVNTADWKLISLKPFDTEETLTVELVDKVVEITVTDAQDTIPDSAIARVSNDSGSTWSYHSALIGTDTGSTSDGGVDVSSQGAFNYANTLTGDVVIELLKETDAGYTLTSGFTFNNSGMTSLTIRTASSVLSTSGRSVITKNHNASMITVTFDGMLNLEDLILLGPGSDAAGPANGGAVCQSASGSNTGIYASNVDFGALNADGETADTSKAFASGTYGGAVYTVAKKAVTFEDCNFYGSTAGHSGGGVHFQVDAQNTLIVTFKGTSFVDCLTRASGHGAAFCQNYGKTLCAKETIVENCVFRNCKSATWAGAALIRTKYKVTITGSTFSDCANSGGNSGAVYIEARPDVEAEVSNCSFTNCQNNGAGGGLYIGNDSNAKKVTISSCQFDQCKGSNGGAVYASAAELFVDQCAFTDCTATTGGAIYGTGNITITAEAPASVFQNCTATGDGGAIYHAGALMQLTNVSFGVKNDPSKACTANRGGSIAASGSGKLVYANTTDQEIGFFYTADANSATITGGTIYAEKSYSVEVKNTSAEGSIVFDHSNIGNASGGAVYLEGGKFVADGNKGTILFNDCLTRGGSYSGGAVCARGGFTANNNSGTIRFTGCVAGSNSGGAIYAGGVGFQAENNTGSFIFEQCSAPNGSGGAICSGGAITIENAGIGSTSFTGCTASTGGAIYGSNNITITAPEEGSLIPFVSCKATGDGGAIYHAGTLMQLTNVSFGAKNDQSKACTANRGGSIAAANNGKLVYTNTTGKEIGFFYTADANSATITGGTIYAANSYSVELHNTQAEGTITFDHSNIGNASGGAVFLDGGKFVADGNKGTILFNDCLTRGGSYSGGAVCARGGFTANNNSGRIRFTDCVAGAASGGAIYAGGVGVQVENNTGSFAFEHCCAPGSGGAICVVGGDCVLTGIGTITIGSNETGKTYASASGGAIYHGAAGAFALQNATITEAYCAAGNNQNGGAIYSAASQFELTGCKIFAGKAENDAASEPTAYLGGAIFHTYADANKNADRSMKITDTTIAGFVAKNAAGGGVWSNAQSLTLSNVTVQNCKANHTSSSKGAGIYSEATDVTFEKSVTITGNSIGNATVANAAGLYLTQENAIINIKGGNGTADIQIYDNLTSDGKQSNLKTGLGAPCIEITGVNMNGLTGKVGVVNPTQATKDRTFARSSTMRTAGSDEALKALFVDDTDISQAEYKGILRMRMTWAPYEEAPVCKITDTNGQLLFYKSETEYVAAVFASLGDAFGALEEYVADPTVFAADNAGTALSAGVEPANVEMLAERYTVDAALNIPDGIAVTLKTASSGTGDYDYKGTENAVIIRGGVAAGSLFVMDGDDALTVTVITLDGGSKTITINDNYKNNNQHGGIIRADGADCSLTLSEGAVLQNSYIYNSKHGGAVYMADGGRFVMENGALIKDCRADSGYGGAVCLSGSNHPNTKFEGSTIMDCYGSLGGSVYSDADLAITGFTFTWSNPKANSSESNGGMVYVSDQCANLTVSNTTFTNFRAGSNGGAIYSDATGTVTVQDCTFRRTQDNYRGAANGGAIFANKKNSVLDVINCSFSRIRSGYHGGAIYANTGVILNVTGTGREDVMFDHCFSADSAYYGGAVYANGTVSMKDLKIQDCHAGYSVSGDDYSGLTYSAGRGGALALGSSGTAVLEKVTITGCSAGMGGAIYSENATASALKLIHTSVTGNRLNSAADSSFNAGGIYMANNSTLTIGDGSDTDTTDIKDNTGFTGDASNLRLSQTGTNNTAAALKVSSELSGEIYVVNPGADATQFGTKESSITADVAEKIHSDAANRDTEKRRTDEKLYWTGSPVCKITDADGNLRTKKDSTDPAVYDALEDAFADFSNITDAANIEMFVPEYRMSRYVDVPAKTITLKTAAKGTGEYDYPQDAENPYCVIKRGSVPAGYAMFHLNKDNLSLTVENLILDGQELASTQAGSILFLQKNSTSNSLTIGNNVVLQNGKTSNNGGAVYAENNTKLAVAAGTKFINCQASNGGAIFYKWAKTADVSLEGLAFENCKATNGYGGAVYTYTSNLSIYNTTFSGCSSTTNGGAVYDGTSGAGTLTVTGAAFTNCKAGNYGGGLYTNIVTAKVADTTFTDCYVTGSWGGALHAESDTADSTLELSKVSFTDCFNGDGNYGNGGAVYTRTKAVKVTDCHFTNCRAATNGGAIIANGTPKTVQLTNCKFTGCSANGVGGSVYVPSANAAFTITNCSFDGTLDEAFTQKVGTAFKNSSFTITRNATRGGAVYATGPVTIEDSSFSGSSAQYGGGLFAERVATLKTGTTGVSFTNCQSSSHGGGVYFNVAETDVLKGKVSFDGCRSTGGYGGGAFFNNTVTLGDDLKLSFKDCGADSASSGYGGGAYFNGIATVNEGAEISFDGCYSGLHGGGAYFNAAETNVLKGKLTWKDCYSTAGYGGGVYFYNTVTLPEGAQLSFTGCHTDSDTAGNGGGAYFYSTVTVDAETDISFDGCYSGLHGGGVYYNSTATLNNAQNFKGCYANDEKGYGGAVYARGTLTMTTPADKTSSFTNCHAMGGGALYAQGTTSVSGGTTKFERCISKTAGGGAIWKAGSAAMTITDAVIENCEAQTAENKNYYGGSAIYIADGYVTLKGTGVDDSGNAKMRITGCKAATGTNGSVATVGGAINMASGKIVNFEGEVDISGNTNTANDTSNQHNVVLDQNNNAMIKTTASGLGSHAQIGVYVTGDDSTQPYSGHGKYSKPFGTWTKNNGNINLSGFVNDRDSKLTGMVHTSDQLIYWGSDICKIVDAEGTEHAFASLNEAVAYARANKDTLPMNADTPAVIEMLVDYTIENWDKVALNQEGDNFVITTAATTGEGLLFSDSLDGKAAADQGTAVLTRGWNTDAAAANALFLVNHASAKLVTENIIFDGSRNEANTSGFAGRAIYNNNGSLSVRGNSVFRNFYTGGIGGAIYDNSKYLMIGVPGEDKVIFENCFAPHGGAIGSKATVLADVKNTEFKNCIAYSGSAGGVYFEGYDANVLEICFEKTVFDQCLSKSTNGYGGAFCERNEARCIAKKTTVRECCFTGCTSQHWSGAAIIRSTDTEIVDTTFDGCYSTSTSSNCHGGALYIGQGSGDIRLVRTSFRNSNMQNGAGGAVYLNNEFNTLDIEGCTFDTCSAGSSGGAVYARVKTGLAIGNSEVPDIVPAYGTAADREAGGTLRTEFKNCTARSGGAVYSTGAVTVTDADFSSCRANAHGGAIYGENAITVKGCTFDTISCKSNGGAVYATGSLTVENAEDKTTVFTDCSAYSGGAIYANNTLNISGGTTTFDYCSSTMAGGAICREGNAGNPLSISDAAFTGCTAGSGGGAVYSNITAAVAVTDCSFADCEHTCENGAGGGGAIWKAGSGAMTVTDSVFKDCASHAVSGKNYYGGGAVYVADGNATFAGAAAEGETAKLRITGCSADVTSSVTGGAINSAAAKKLYFEGNVYIYDNLDSRNKPHNVVLAQDNMSTINVTENGLTEGSQIGVFVVDTYLEKRGVAYKDFGTRVSGYTDHLNSFINDRYPLVGGEGNSETAIAWTTAYRLVLDPNGGDGTPVSAVLTYLQEYTLTNPYSKEGYYFTGWNTRKDGSGISYSASDVVSGLTKEEGGTFTLYAQWEVYKPVTLYFHAEGGVELDPVERQSGTKLGLLPSTTRKGYFFAGWKLKKDGKEISYTQDMILDRDVEPELHFYANWDKKIKITFDPQGGEPGEWEREIAPGKIGTLPLVEQPDATKDDFKFDGWYTEETGGTKVTADTVFTEDTTIYAHWSVWKRRLGYDYNYSTASNGYMSGRYSYGEYVEDIDQIRQYAIPYFPEISNLNHGYRFIGWFTEKEGGRELHVNNIIDLRYQRVVHAHWEKLEDAWVTVTFDSDGGSSCQPVELVKGDVIELYPTPTRSGYDFSGWFLTNESGNIAAGDDGKDIEVTNVTPVTENITVKAKWTEKEPVTPTPPKEYVTVTFNQNNGTENPTIKTVSVEKGKTVTAIPGMSRGEGFILEGWYPSEDGSGDKLTSETIINGDCTYYANWIPAKVTEQSDDIKYDFNIIWTNESTASLTNVNDHLTWYTGGSTGGTAIATALVRFKNYPDQGMTLPAYAVEIQIPKYVFEDWDGNKITGTNDIVKNVPKDPTTRAGYDWSYRESEDQEYYILVNSSPLQSNELELKITYTAPLASVKARRIDTTTGRVIDATGRPVAVDDYQPRENKFTVTVHPGGDIADRVHERKLYTGAQKTYTYSASYSKGNVSGPITSWNSSWGTKPADAEEYYYIKWTHGGFGGNAVTNGLFVVNDKIWLPDAHAIAVDANGKKVRTESYVVTRHRYSDLVNGRAVHYKKETVTGAWEETGAEETGTATLACTVDFYSILWEDHGSSGGESVTALSGSKGNGRGDTTGQDKILADQAVSSSFSLSMSGPGKANVVKREDANIYCAKEYTMIMRDGDPGDISYYSASRGKSVTLGDNDYNLTSVSISVSNRDGYKDDLDYWHGLSNTSYSSWQPVQVWIRKTGQSEYEHYSDVVFKTTSSGSISLPDGTVGVEIRHNTSYWSTSLGATVGIRINATDHVKELVQEDYLIKKTSTFVNQAEFSAVQTETGEPLYTGTGSGSFAWNKSKTRFAVGKSAGSVDDDVNAGTQTVPITVTGSNENNAGYDKYIYSGIFYEFLPREALVEESSVYVDAGGTRINRSMVNVEFVPDWKESGRTMMIVSFSVPDTVKAKSVSMHYGLKNTYVNILARGASMYCQSAFVNTTEFKEPYDWYYSPESEKIAKSKTLNKIYEGEFAFGELETQYGDYIAYSDVTANYSPINTASFGFSALVNTQNVLEKDTHVVAANEYTYVLSFSQSANKKSGNIAFFNPLEAGTTRQASDWQGTLIRVDVSGIEKLKGEDGAFCAPVVYYSTKDRASLTDADFTYDALDGGSTWTAEKPADLSTVTAVAVDCRKTVSGSEFILKDQQSVNVNITMKAPDDQALEGKMAVNQVIAYAEDASTGLQGSPERYVNNTTITMKIPKPEIMLTADPGSGTEAAPALVAYKDTVTYDIAVTSPEDETTDFVYKNIIIEDVLPVETAPEMNDIYVYTDDPSKFAKIGSSTRVGMTEETTAEGKKKLTFTVYELLPAETLHIAIPTITNIREGVFSDQAQLTSAHNMTIDPVLVTDATWHEVKRYPVQFSKKILGTEALLGGADLQLLDSSGEVLDEWTSISAEGAGTWHADVPEAYRTSIPNGYRRMWLGADEYTLKEVEAPDNYAVAEAVKFTVSRDGKITVRKKVTEGGRTTVADEAVTGNSIDMYDKYIAVDTVITNAVTEGKGDQNKEFTYEVVMTGLKGGKTYTAVKTGTDGNAVSGGAGTFTASRIGSASYTFKLKSGEKMILEKLPTGAKVTVTQKGSDYESLYTASAGEGENLNILHIGECNEADQDLTTQETGVDIDQGVVTFAFVNTIAIDGVKVSFLVVDEADSTKAITGSKLKVEGPETDPAEDRVVRTWTSGADAKVITLPLSAEYTLTQVSAPEQYTGMAGTPKLTVSAAGELTLDTAGVTAGRCTLTGDTTSGYIVTIQNRKRVSLTVRNFKAESDWYLPGAAFKVTRQAAEGETPETVEWTAENKGKEVYFDLDSVYIVEKTSPTENYEAVAPFAPLGEDGKPTGESPKVTVRVAADGTITVDDAVTLNRILDNQEVYNSREGTLTFYDKYVIQSVPLTITNTVTGGMCDLTREFTYTLKISDDAGSYGYVKEETTDGTNWTAVSENGGGILDADNYTFTLKHNQRVVIQVPANKKITVTEERNGHEVTVSEVIPSGGTSGLTEEGISLTKDISVLGQTNGGSFTLTGPATIAFTNNMDDVAPTGAAMRFLPFILILLGGLAIFGMFAVTRRKREA